MPGHSLRQAALREILNAGAEIDLETGDFHPNDAATLLKAYLGELPEPLLTHRHYNAHLKIGGLCLSHTHIFVTLVGGKKKSKYGFASCSFVIIPFSAMSRLDSL